MLGQLRLLPETWVIIRAHAHELVRKCPSSLPHSPCAKGWLPWSSVQAGYCTHPCTCVLVQCFVCALQQLRPGDIFVLFKTVLQDPYWGCWVFLPILQYLLSPREMWCFIRHWFCYWSKILAVTHVSHCHTTSLDLPFFYSLLIMGHCF